MVRNKSCRRIQQLIIPQTINAIIRLRKSDVYFHDNKINFLRNRPPWATTEDTRRAFDIFTVTDVDMLDFQDALQ